MKKDYRNYLSLLLAALLLTGCSQTASVNENIPLVRTQTISLGANNQNPGYSGEVRGRYETALSFQTGGKIIQRQVEAGTHVKAGDVLLTIDPKDIQQTVNLTAAQVASADSQLRLAQSNLARYEKLYEQGAISRAQLDQYQNAYEVAQAAVNQASAQYAQGNNQLNYSQLTADSDGVIADINVEAGQVVSAGQTVLTLVKDGMREIEINIPENKLEELKNASHIQVTFWALPGITSEGKVREIAPMADKVTRTYKARISLVNPPADLQLGMTATVNINHTGSQSIFIPLAALYQTGDTPNVWVVTDNQVALRPVKVGAFGDNAVEILDGLHEGDVIVCAGVQKLHEGQKVRL